MSESTLRERVTLDEVIDHFEYLDVSIETIKGFYERYKFMCGGQDNWVSLEIWRIYTQLKDATDALDRLRQVPGAFPNE